LSHRVTNRSFLHINHLPARVMRHTAPSTWPGRYDVTRPSDNGPG
jgi:hypothetical protein